MVTWMKSIQCFQSADCHRIQHFLTGKKTTHEVPTVLASGCGDEVLIFVCSQLEYVHVLVYNGSVLNGRACFVLPHPEKSTRENEMLQVDGGCHMLQTML
mmetsp:Transcript_30172/g.36630  ORF Transcript_30172/g.36630 Transcript_30172/m.36630 type:complete len:100 (-) Transcript_30172:129-428(-)